MARCNDCNKFVSYDEPELEIEETDDDSHTLTVTAAIRLGCADCSTELKSGVIELTADLEDVKPPEDATSDWAPCEEGEHEWDGRDDLEIESVETKKRMYGAKVHGRLTCERCQATVDVEVTNEIGAGELEDSQ
jgi:hypothetical protein